MCSSCSMLHHSLSVCLQALSVFVRKCVKENIPPQQFHRFPRQFDWIIPHSGVLGEFLFFSFLLFSFLLFLLFSCLNLHLQHDTFILLLLLLLGCFQAKIQVLLKAISSIKKKSQLVLWRKKVGVLCCCYYCCYCCYCCCYCNVL